MEKGAYFGLHEGRFMADAVDRRIRAGSSGLDEQVVHHASFYIYPDSFAAGSLKGFLRNVIGKNPNLVDQARYFVGTFSFWKKQASADFIRRAKQNSGNEFLQEKLGQEADTVNSLTVQDIHVFAQEQYFSALEQSVTSRSISEIKFYDKEKKWWREVCEVTHYMLEQRKSAEQRELEEKLSIEYVKQVCKQPDPNWSVAKRKEMLNKEAEFASDHFISWIENKSREIEDIEEAKIADNLTLEQIAFVAGKKCVWAMASLQSASAIGVDRIEDMEKADYWIYAEEVMRMAVELDL